LFFEGGGGYFDYRRCRPGTRWFDDSIGPDDVPAFGSGMLDLDDPENPVHGWTTVFVPSTTGDVHWGTPYLPGVRGTQRHHRASRLRQRRGRRALAVCPRPRPRDGARHRLQRRLGRFRPLCDPALSARALLSSVTRWPSPGRDPRTCATRLTGRAGSSPRGGSTGRASSASPHTAAPAGRERRVGVPPSSARSPTLKCLSPLKTGHVRRDLRRAQQAGPRRPTPDRARRTMRRTRALLRVEAGVKPAPARKQASQARQRRRSLVLPALTRLGSRCPPTNSRDERRDAASVGDLWSERRRSAGWPSSRC
jgi:hypothetical protein